MNTVVYVTDFGWFVSVLSRLKVVVVLMLLPCTTVATWLLQFMPIFTHYCSHYLRLSILRVMYVTITECRSNTEMWFDRGCFVEHWLTYNIMCRVRTTPSKPPSPNTQHYWVLSIPIPNTETGTQWSTWFIFQPYTCTSLPILWLTTWHVCYKR